MHDQIEQLQQAIYAQLQDVSSVRALEQLRVETLGKKGSISLLMRGLGKMTAEERKQWGPLLNGLKDKVGASLDARYQELADQEMQKRLQAESLDLSLPGRYFASGSLHPIGEVIEEVTAIFAGMGFSVAEGPHIEDDFHNFTALNIPADHPARQEHDTFYFAPDEEGRRPVLRTHTSPVQILNVVFVFFWIKELQFFTCIFFVLAEVKVCSGMNTFKFFKTKRKFKFNIGCSIGIMCQFFMVMKTVIFFAHS